MRHIAIFGDDLEALHRLGIADYVIEENWSILLHPGNELTDRHASPEKGEGDTMAIRNLVPLRS